jgi:hypothetical protein
MKRFIAHTCTSLMLSVLGMTMMAQAETITVIKVNIPFEFAFGGKTFPPGQYSLTQPLQHVLTLRNARGAILGSALSNRVDSPTPGILTRVEFNLVAGQHILSEVWQGQETSGEQLARAGARTQLASHPSSPERETAKGSAAQTGTEESHAKVRD